MRQADAAIVVLIKNENKPMHYEKNCYSSRKFTIVLIVLAMGLSMRLIR